jgi:hypothetical protein
MNAPLTVDFSPIQTGLPDYPPTPDVSDLVSELEQASNLEDDEESDRASLGVLLRALYLAVHPDDFFNLAGLVGRFRVALGDTGFLYTLPGPRMAACGGDMRPEELMAAIDALYQELGDPSLYVPRD